MDLIGDSVDAAKAAYNDALAKWQDVMSNLDMAVSNFNSVQADAQSDPVLADKWNTANGHLQALQGTLSTVQGTIGTIEDWFSSSAQAASDAATTAGNWLSTAASAVNPINNDNIFNQAATSVYDTVSGALNGVRRQGMGALPVVAWIAIITAAVGAVWGVIYELRSVYIAVENKKIADQNILNAQQGKPLVPYISDTGGGLLSGLSDTAKWGAIGFIAWMIYESMKGRRA